MVKLLMGIREGVVSFQPGELTAMLTALSEQLAAARAEPASLVVCGGTAMNALGFVATNGSLLRCGC